MNYKIPILPLKEEIETKTVLKKLIPAHKALSELKVIVDSIPNKDILINTLFLQEAKDSSAVENIITTHDELFSNDYNSNQASTIAVKEVYNYVRALRQVYTKVIDTKLITVNQIIEIQGILQENKAGFRKLPGTTLINDLTKEIIYTPPQIYNDIIELMSNLEKFINTSDINMDPLVKMAMIHHQFESIHPFYDGNGRTGRIINILFLLKEGLLQHPILYLSRYINQNKATYYKLLQHTRDSNDWEQWILFILEAVEQTSLQTSVHN